MRERDTECNRIKELEDTLDIRQSELEALQANVHNRSEEIGRLRSQLSKLTRKDADGNRHIDELERQVRDKTGEVERLRFRVREIENQNAGQDLELVSLKKKLDAQAEEIYQFDIALNAKQQELNMVSALLLSQCLIDRRIA